MVEVRCVGPLRSLIFSYFTYRKASFDVCVTIVLLEHTV